MTIEADINTTLDSHSGLSALVGTRNYTGILPQQSTYPNIVCYRIETNRLNSIDGGAGGGKMSASFTFDIRATTYSAAHDVADQLIDAMETATLYKSLLLNMIDVPYEDIPETFRVSLDFSIWY